MYQFSPSSRVFHQDRFEFFQKFAEIFASQGAPPGANFYSSFASVVDTRGKFATSVNDISGKFFTGVNNAGGKLQVANNENNIRLQTS